MGNAQTKVESDPDAEVINSCVQSFLLAYMLAENNKLPDEACLQVAQLAFDGKLMLAMRAWQPNTFMSRKDLVA